MATRIYVGHLPYSTNDAQLNQLFATYGEVTEATVVMDRDSGQSKGFGFVEMADDTAARSAIEHLNGSVVDDLAIRVDVAQARPDRSARSGDRPRRGSSYRDRQ